MLCMQFYSVLLTLLCLCSCAQTHGDETKCLRVAKPSDTPSILAQQCAALVARDSGRVYADPTLPALLRFYHYDETVMGTALAEESGVLLTLDGVGYTCTPAGELCPLDQ